jgi:transcriptional regulator with XRE-family HTH domain
MSTEQSNSQLGKSVGAKIRAARQALKYTQSQLATPEFSVSYISAIERGQIQPSLRALEILAKRLGIPSAQLIQLDIQNDHTLGFATSVALSDEALLELALLEAQIYMLQDDATKAIALLCELPASKLQKKYLLQHRFLLGWAYLLTSELHKCIVTLAEGESLANEQNDSSYSLYIYDLMGMAYASMGDDARALQIHERCFNMLVATQARDPFFLCHLYNQLGQHYTQLQKNDAATHAFQQAITIIEELTTPQNLQRAYWDNALYYAAAKEYQSACVYLHKCLELQNQRVHAPLRSEIYHSLGRALMKGDQAKARTYLEDALQQKPNLLDALTLASIMTRLAEWFLLHNQLPEAEKYAEKASELAKPFGTTLITSEALIMWGRIQYTHESYKSADKHFAAGLEMLEHLHVPQEQSDQSALYAQLLDARGKTKEALHYYKRAYESQRRTGEFFY